MAEMKPLRWIGQSKQRLKEFPESAMDEAGFQLQRVQQGLAPADWKTVPTVGAGVIEIRVHYPGEYRVFYIAKYTEAIYVLHAFSKKTQKTSDKDLDIAKAAYAQLQNQRKEIY